MQLGWRRLSRTARAILAGVTAVALCSAPISFPATASAAAKATGTVITTAPGPFGTQLVVGSGKYAGYSLYLLTSDQPSSSVCTATIIKTLPGGPGSCAGPSNDQKAEWPAITTNGSPVAGAGVQESLLGVRTRPGIGVQITYAGHLLYLFDQGPGQVTGEGWDEPTLPPWHGLWWLVSPTGAPLAWPGTLTTTHIGGKAVLAALMFTGIGWEPFPVYSYTKDSASTSTCTGPCAADWPPVLTSGRAGVESSVAAAEVSTVKRADGTTQLTYKGRPLYLYGSEGIGLVAGLFEATGSGNGVKVDGGTFQLVSP
jgi:predicted lipoprotein with Yx(FWY)xxD motif